MIDEVMEVFSGLERYQTIAVTNCPDKGDVNGGDVNGGDHAV